MPDISFKMIRNQPADINIDLYSERHSLFFMGDAASAMANLHGLGKHVRDSRSVKAITLRAMH